jgi:hypothetical protein
MKKIGYKIKQIIMLSLIDVLRSNGGIVENGAVMITCKGIDQAVTTYAYEYVIKELESLLQNNSTQAYWPAIIKQRINQLKGENNG